MIRITLTIQYNLIQKIQYDTIKLITIQYTTLQYNAYNYILTTYISTYYHVKLRNRFLFVSLPQVKK